MKNNTTLLRVITYVVLISTTSILINDIQEFNFEQFKSFASWSKSVNKNENWFTSKNAIMWSYYIIITALFFWRGYLIYGFTHFVSILKEIEKENYFSQKNINYFKKIGNVFITYTINVLVLQFLLSVIQGASFNFFKELKNEFTFLIPCGLAFYLLAEIFKRAKTLKEENDLTI
ncbi:DUF2975 domain-containing protein [Aquimarina sp. AD10]|uniref:DUF2975 domain-containing protein n=2 Tax=Aquimarina TaxID=290174 RepID=A0A162CNL6_9FLAO|nr:MULTISPECIES: DUF2975 domain-containing protein [Aquimarina]AXT62142.1 DUF2975 domain-containing protein [Aquimarina sp. AD10]KZS39834.1 hypothetical protein AWE51_09305 [Aquimarina aggregata]